MEASPNGRDHLTFFFFWGGGWGNNVSGTIGLAFIFVICMMLYSHISFDSKNNPVR